MTDRLIDRLPPVRGRVRENEPLAPYTWFQVGGPAEVLFKPADIDDLIAFLANRPTDVPLTVIGAGSNLLVRDGGVPGVVIRLGGAFAKVTVEDGTRLRAGAAALDSTVIATACEAGISGLEFLSGIPGSIGGALRMNCGAHGTEMKDVILEARALDPQGTVHRLSPAELGLRYRQSAVPEGWIFLDALLQGTPGDPQAIGERMARILAERGSSQPVRSRTGGSTFANPPGDSAWKLIDRAGCRGLKIGGAEVSEMHCNFLINTGDATGADIETLGEEVCRRVLAVTGIALSWEIRRIGVHRKEQS